MPQRDFEDGLKGYSMRSPSLFSDDAEIKEIERDWNAGNQTRLANNDLANKLGMPTDDYDNISESYSPDEKTSTLSILMSILVPVIMIIGGYYYFFGGHNNNKYKIIPPVETQTQKVQSSMFFNFNSSREITLYLMPGCKTSPIGGRIQIKTPNGGRLPIVTPEVCQKMELQGEGFYTIYAIDKTTTGVQILNYW